MAFAAANWYYDQLGGQKPLVILTDDPESLGYLKNKRLEIFVLSTGDYLDKFWSSLPSIKECYDNLVESKQLKALAGPKESEDFTDYLKQEVLEAGVRTGRFVQGL